jgi:hypothetical protein
MHWKVRLEKIFLGEKSWWAPKSEVSSQDCRPTKSDDHSCKNWVVKSEECSTCSKTSKKIYNAGFTCLNPECTAFFVFEHGYDLKTLDSNEEFLKTRTAYLGDPVGPLTPPLPTNQDIRENAAYGIEAQFAKGMVCQKCGCCSRRISWNHWDCENAKCDFSYQVEQRSVPASLAIQSSMQVITKDIFPCKIVNYGAYEVNLYNMLGEAGEVIGTVRHFKSNGIINSQAGGPNNLFKEMQEGDFNLRRSPAKGNGGTCSPCL